MQTSMTQIHDPARARAFFEQKVAFTTGPVELDRLIKSGDNHIAVVDVRCRYKAPARYDDVIIVRTRLMHVRDSLLHFAYEIARDGESTPLAEGESVHIVVNAQFKRVRLPKKYLARFQETVMR